MICFEKVRCSSKIKPKVASRVDCSERGVVYFRELLFKFSKKKFSLRRINSEKIGITGLE